MEFATSRTILTRPLSIFVLRHYHDFRSGMGRSRHFEEYLNAEKVAKSPAEFWTTAFIALLSKTDRDLTIQN
jgi:hypothetical protein